MAMISPFLLLLLLIPFFLVILFLLLSFFTRPKPVRIPIKNRHVFITGGSSGIGLALAKSAASEGARVSILARNMKRLEEAKESIKLATGCEVEIYSADVRDPTAVKNAIEKAGPVDVLICNQGVFVPLELEKQELEEAKFMIDVNLMGTFHLIKAALPAMKRNARETGQPASIAIMSSQAGQVGVYGYTAYSASKFALRGLAECLQHEVISDNIHISMIFPPDTQTPGFAAENEKRPALTSIISASSGAMEADDVAKKALEGLKRGQFTIPCNFDGAMLAIATAGMSPQRSSVAALCEVLLIGFMRFLGLGYQWSWFSAIQNYQQT
ncbi:hypothetical protein LUZ60_017011 [Juncus effusus]|nr:hypothetical protein LUZ60_017011 [Juncus effusus]